MEAAQLAGAEIRAAFHAPKAVSHKGKVKLHDGLPKPSGINPQMWARRLVNLLPGGSGHGDGSEMRGFAAGALEIRSSGLQFHW